MWPQAGEEEEPDWVQTEREHFDKWRDLDKVRLLRKSFHFFVYL